MLTAIAQLNPAEQVDKPFRGLADGAGTNYIARMKPSTSALKPTVGKVVKQPSAEAEVAKKTSGRKPVARVAKSSTQAELSRLLERINRNLDETEALLAS